jgi:tetratricopeptide (TPR) repeat protein
LAIYYCNRAACLIQLGRFEEALLDCDVSAILSPSYVKAYVRRSTAYEKTERTEEALQDAKTAFAMEPINATLRQRVAQLQKVEDERLEKLKAETFDKLKELGNSVLGNFGLSLDNFKAVQDPNTGSYSISFEQNK